MSTNGENMNNPDPDFEPLYTAREVGEIMGVSDWTVRQWIHRGQLRGAKFGTGWRVRKSDLRTYIANRYELEQE